MAKTWFEWDELYDKFESMYNPYPVQMSRASESMYNPYPVQMSRAFESMYNPYPVQMSRAEAFGKARNDGLITDEEYREAQEFYGNLWRYTGD